MSYLSPGIYREERFLTPSAPMPTGVPGFVGFGRTKDRAPLLVHRPEELADGFKQDSAVEGYLADAIAGFFANGGQRCYLVGADANGNPDHDEAALIAATADLAPVEDLDLVAIPDAMCLAEPSARLRVQEALVTHCQKEGNRFAILDAPSVEHLAKEWETNHSDLLTPTENDLIEVLIHWCQSLGLRLAHPENSACYYPWVKAARGTGGTTYAVPPCGHVAGIYARSDGRVGVHKAPANEVLEGIHDLEFAIDANIQGRLNPVGINCLRTLPGRGLRLYGARTLSQAPAWQYVNVRRLVLTVGRWIDRNMAWAAFEPNGPRLWIRIQRELDAYLGGLWQSGALRGASANQAYFVKCDGETNSPEGREQGQVITEIGLAPAAPAEFVVLRITHSAYGSQFGESTPVQ